METNTKRLVEALLLLEGMESMQKILHMDFILGEQDWLDKENEKLGMQLYNMRSALEEILQEYPDYKNEE